MQTKKKKKEEVKKRSRAGNDKGKEKGRSLVFNIIKPRGDRGIQDGSRSSNQLLKTHLGQGRG